MRTFCSLAAAALLAATTVNAQTATVSTSALSASIAACPVQQYVLNNTGTAGQFPVQVQDTTAGGHAGFYVQYTNVSKMLTNQFSTEQYLLTLNGANTPVTTGFQSFNISLAKRFSIPFQSGVCLPETTANTYLQLLGVLGTVSQASQFSSNACILQQQKNGVIGQYDGSTDSACTVTIGANGYTYSDKQANPDPKVIAFPNTYVLTMLARAEYLKYVAVLFNKEAAATVIYNGIQSRYQSLAAQANAAAATNGKKTVAWVTFNAVSSYNPTASWTIVTNTTSNAYRANLTGDAGANYFNDTAGGSYSDATSWLNALKAGGVTTLIDETYIYGTEADGVTMYLAWNSYDTWLQYLQVNGTDTSQYTFLQQANVYRDDKSQSPTDLSANPQVIGYDDWFESALANADAALKDFISITQPTVTGSTYTTTWFRNIADNQIRVLNQCSNPNAPIAPLLDSSVSYTSVSCPSFLLTPAVASTTPPNAATSAGISVAAMLAATLVSAILML